MVDHRMSAYIVVAGALWAVTFTLIAAAWITTLVGHQPVGMLLGLTGCVTSAAAATAHVKTFSLRVCSVMRASMGDVAHEGRPEGDVRPIR